MIHQTQLLLSFFSFYLLIKFVTFLRFIKSHAHDTKITLLFHYFKPDIHI